MAILHHPRQRRPLQELIAPLFGFVVCDRPDGERGTEWLPRREFRTCEGCDALFHVTWGNLCPNCSGAD